MAIHFQFDAVRQSPLRRTSLVLPDSIVGAVLRSLDHVARALVRLGVSANAITAGSIALGAAGGVLLALGEFPLAAFAMVVASLGDALDGLVARRGGTSSVAGALLDASGDRYQEFFFFGGLAVFFRHSAGALVLTLLALAGSYMVSYGSAKAEALAAAVPPSVMRRAERAACLCLGVILTAACGSLARRLGWPAWADTAPLLASLGLIAVGANTSAVRRLHSLASASSESSAVVRRDGRPADVVQIEFPNRASSGSRRPAR
jgi:CDP-diacylglycerol---glycerol-3-phosphate 3-phosphatidyltransferase